MLARDAMWKLSRWYNADLKNWLDREKPDMIFTAPGSAKFIYDIALKISRELNIPIVAYICDDYYFVKKADSVLGRIQQKLLRRRIDQLFAHTSHIITICDELNELYSAKFGVPAATVMTGSNYPISRDVKVCGNPTTITYFGNIRCDRYVSLAEIGRALDSINSERGTDYILNIYSGEKDSEILSHFDGIRAIRFRGFVGGEEFDEAFRSSEILLHTEAFDEDSVDLVKHSVSTKIADSLASGIPMFAYGPAEVSSMKHLLRNECAVTATSQAELKTKLEELFDDAALRREAAENGIAAAERLHNTPVSSARVYEIIESVQRAKP